MDDGVELSGHSPDLSKATFYSNLNGTSKAEISLVLTINPASVLLRTSMQIALAALGFQEGLVAKFVLDFAILSLPLCLSVTLLSNAALQIIFTEIILSFALLLIALQSSGLKRKQLSMNSVLQTPMEGRLPFITNFRVLNNMGVAVGILAVDFVVFPRKFAKTETFGTGIMDAGVGVYVFMNAMVSPEARGTYHRSGLKSVVKSLTSSLPLLVLGLGRLASIKGIDYHEHVSEYGVHWNFFFTLAATKILCSLVLLVMPVSWSAITALSLALGYQCLLSGLGLQDLVLHGSDMRDSREGLLNANREGLASCLGYVAIYFAGVKLGQYILKPRKAVGSWLKALVYILLVDVMLWIVLGLVEDHIGPTSRRLANLPYVVWNVALSLHVLCSFLFVDIIFAVIQHHYFVIDQSTHLSLLVSAIGRNLLLYFLLANLMTGFVNITIDTIHQNDTIAFIIIAVYMFLLHFILVFLHKKNINTKFW